jgi:hypothetical protein
MRFRKLLGSVNGVWLCSAKVGSLADEAKSWGEDIILDGFQYDAFSEDAPIDAKSRLEWLAKQSKSGSSDGEQVFKPQPWEHLIRTLRATGHGEQARQVGIAREKHLRNIGRIGCPPFEWGQWGGWLYRTSARAAHFAFGVLADFGYRPLKLVWWMLGVWLLFAHLYWWAAHDGQFTPTNPLIFNAEKYAPCAENWYLCGELNPEHTGFSPLAYSLDLLLPVVDLQQANDWAPRTPTPLPEWHLEALHHWSMGHVVRLLTWIEILFGWGQRCY